MASAPTADRRPHDHRNRRLVRHRSALRPGAARRGLAGLRHGAPAAGHRRHRGGRDRMLLPRLPRGGLDRRTGRRRPGAHRRPPRRALQQRRLLATGRRRGPARFGAARAVRGQSVRLARPDASPRACHAAAGPWADRLLFVDPRPCPRSLPRRLRGVQACTGRAHAVPARRARRLGRARLPDRAGPGRILIAVNARAWFERTSTTRPRSIARPTRPSSPACVPAAPAPG